MISGVLCTVHSNLQVSRRAGAILDLLELVFGTDHGSQSCREVVDIHVLCESGVEGENQHRSSKPPEHMHEQTAVGTDF